MSDDKRTLGIRARVWSSWVLIAFIGIGAFLLLTEHRAHIYGWLPHLLLSLCVVLLYLNSRIAELELKQDEEQG